MRAAITQYYPAESALHRADPRAKFVAVTALAIALFTRDSFVALAVYGAAGAGLAVGRGVRAIILTNQNGAVLELSGRQSGLMVNVDLSGLALTIK